MTLLWGLGLVVVRLGFRERVAPFGGCAIRFLIAAALGFALCRARRVPVPLSAAALERYLACGVLLMALPFGLVYLGLARCPSGVGAVTAATMPLQAALAARLLLGERLPLRMTAGSLLGLAGIAWIYRDSLAGGGIDPTGLALLLGAATANALAAVYVRGRCGGCHPLPLNSVAMLVGGLLLGLLSTTMEPSASWPTPLGWLTVIWLAVFSSVVCYAIYTWLLAKRSVSSVTLTSLLFPLVTLALEPAILHETLPSGAWPGALTVLTGVAIALLARRACSISIPDPTNIISGVRH